MATSHTVVPPPAALFGALWVSLFLLLGFPAVGSSVLYGLNTLNRMGLTGSASDLILSSSYLHGQLIPAMIAGGIQGLFITLFCVRKPADLLYGVLWGLASGSLWWIAWLGKEFSTYGDTTLVWPLLLLLLGIKTSYLRWHVGSIRMHVLIGWWVSIGSFVLMIMHDPTAWPPALLMYTAGIAYVLLHIVQRNDDHHPEVA
jgi:hypothetical protein